MPALKYCCGEQLIMVPGTRLAPEGEMPGRGYRRLRLDGAFRFKCVRCDYCCGTGPNIALTAYDVIRMSRRLGMYWKSFLETFTNVIIADMLPFISLKGDEKGECLFMERDEEGLTSCRIYDARPMKCRFYPLHVASPSATHVYLDTKCPGVDLGGEERVPTRLYEQYVWELKNHYSRLHRLVFEEGYEPLQALYKLLDDLWAEAWREKPPWSDLKHIEDLGST